MSMAGSYMLPAVFFAVMLYGFLKGVDVFSAFVSGAAEGVKVCVRILPSLVALMTAVGVFSASGALDMLTAFLQPFTDFIGLPRQVTPLALLRPISGSGALAVFSDILSKYGPDSYIGRVASVLQGSTETTFYTIAVYFGATKITKTRHTLPASLLADLTGFVMSGFFVRMLLG